MCTAHNITQTNKYVTHASRAHTHAFSFQFIFTYLRMYVNLIWCCFAVTAVRTHFTSPSSLTIVAVAIAIAIVSNWSRTNLTTQCEWIRREKKISDKFVSHLHWHYFRSERKLIRFQSWVCSLFAHLDCHQFRRIVFFFFCPLISNGIYLHQ